MLKMRLMGTRADIEWLMELLKHIPELNIVDTSDIYANSGTSRFYRCYTELERNNVLTGLNLNNAGKQVQSERY